jgi:predicted Zn-ribbon and HTH transcriptional regulator
MRETLREFDRKMGELLGESRVIYPDEIHVTKTKSGEVRKYRPQVCRKCGYVGGNSRGCGTKNGHATVEVPQKKPVIAIVK